jgi:hypothetical protein
MVPAPFLLTAVLSLAFGLISFIEFPCPTCGGTGTITTSAVLKAEVTTSRLVESYIPLTCCDHPQVQYTYDVTLSVNNPSTEPVSSTVMVSFYDIEPALSNTDTVNPASEGDYPVQVDVQPGKTITVEQELSFIAVSDIMNQPHTVTVQSDGSETKNACPLCGGKGKLAFYAWVEAKVK